MLVKDEKGNITVKSFAYFKNYEERLEALKKIRSRRIKPIFFTDLLPKKQQIENRKRVAKYVRENTEKCNKKNKLWRENNKEKFKEISRKSRLKGKEKGKFRQWAIYWRERILAEKGSNCETCNATENLEIHHKKYTKNLEDLQILCRKCHRKLDRKYSDEELGVGN